MNNTFNRSWKQYPHETAAIKLAEEQHTPGVTARMNPTTFRIEYIRQDGSIVPGYDYYLKLAYAGKI